MWSSPKTEALSETLSKINPYVAIIAHNVVLDGSNIRELFAEAEVIVECFDGAEAKAMIMDCVATSLPRAYLVAASGVAGHEDGNTIRTRRLGERIYVIGDLETAARPGRGLMAPRVGIAAHHQAATVVNLLIDPELTRSQVPDMLG
jgi:sulfur carrier protein ThiS adenylyltransferase